MPDDIHEKVEAFFQQYRLKKYPKGQVLILGGDQSDHIFYLVSGHVKQYDVTYRGDELVLNIFKAPAFFPMSMVINHTQNIYVYEADTDIEVRLAPVEEALDFIKANPDVMFNLLSRVYRGVDGLIGRIRYLMSGSAKSRLMYEILIEAKRFGTKLPNGSCDISISEKDLGAHAGLSRETVSREVTKLKKEGVITLEGKTIRIQSLSRLEKSLGQEY